MDIGRELIIIYLLFFLIRETNIVFLETMFSFILFIHLYKLIYNYREYYQITQQYIGIYLSLFILLLYSLYLYIHRGKPYYFIVFFIGFRIISSQLNNYHEIEPKTDNINNLLLSVVLMVISKIYSKYKYREVFIMDSINHFLLFIGL